MFRERLKPNQKDDDEEQRRRFRHVPEPQPGTSAADVGDPELGLFVSRFVGLMLITAGFSPAFLMWGVRIPEEATQREARV